MRSYSTGLRRQSTGTHLQWQLHPPLESVQDFRIVSALASAEFPQAGGGVVDLVTKSGERNFHGNAFEYFRNEATDARNFFDDPLLPRPIFRRNQFADRSAVRRHFRAASFCNV